MESARRQRVGPRGEGDPARLPHVARLPGGTCGGRPRRPRAGLAAAQASFGISLAGGDTDRRPGPFAITIAALGTVPTGKMVRRGTARVGDRLVVSGTLGMPCSASSCVGGRPARRPGASPPARRRASWRARCARSRRLPSLSHCAPLRTRPWTSPTVFKDLGRMAKASGVAARVSRPHCRCRPRRARARGGPEPRRRDRHGRRGLPGARRRGAFGCRGVPGRRSGARIVLTEIGEIQAGTGVRIEDRDGRPLARARAGTISRRDGSPALRGVGPGRAETHQGLRFSLHTQARGQGSPAPRGC